MPIFEYQCRACEQRFETLVRHGEQPQCPECHGDQLEKLLSAPTIGSGLPDTACGNAPSPMCGGGGCGGCQ
ncbi:MAG: zinc ribbon domain-containing protein [Mariprofundaceae bacterium]|nr:zinc ribbon domain-containing protein [Mariprofundaceae bacterium]